MTFKEGYRLEKVYFENIYTLLNMLKSVDKNNVDMNTVKELLDNAIADNESIILIYKNLGELYSEVADNYSKLLADLEALKENLESWKDEINEKIDDLNNYIMSLIRDIEQRLDSLEHRMSDAEEAIDSLEDRMDTAEADIDALEGRMDTAEDDIDALEGRMDTAENDIDSLEGRMDTAEDDIDDLETNKQDKLTAGNGIVIDSNNEISVDTSVVQEKLTAGNNINITNNVISATGTTYSEGTGIDIDSNNVISVDTTVIQEKLTEGNGIDIDSNNEISVDTSVVQEKLTAGNNINITNNVISATDTTYSEGTGIDIDSNNVISADTSVLQEKLVAGSGIAIDPVTNEISNTAQGSTYTAGEGITIDNNTIINDNSQIKQNANTVFFPNYSSSINPSIYYGGRLALFAKSSNLIVPTNAIYTFLEIRIAHAFPSGATYPSYTTTLPDGEYTFAMWFLVYSQQNYVAPFVKTKSVTFKVKVTSGTAEIIGIPFVGYMSVSDFLDYENISGFVAAKKKSNSRITLVRQTNFAIYSENAVLTNSNLTYDNLISALVEYYKASIL